MAKHIYDAQRALDGKPGYSKPLHRTTPGQAKKNRQKTCPSSLSRSRGKQCDEYPYASAKEGGGVLGKTQSRKMIAAEHNRQGEISSASSTIPTASSPVTPSTRV